MASLGAKWERSLSIGQGLVGGCRGPVQPTICARVLCQQLGLGGCHAVGMSSRTVHGTGLGMRCSGWSGPALSDTLPSGFVKGMWQQGCAGREALFRVLLSSTCCGLGYFWLLSKFVFHFK